MRHYWACCVCHLQAIEQLEAALELRRQLFSSSSFLYGDTAALLAKTLIAQHTAAVDARGAAGSSSGSGTSGWFGGGSSSSSSVGGKGGGPPDVLRAIKLWQTAVQIVEDSGEGRSTAAGQAAARASSFTPSAWTSHTYTHSMPKLAANACSCMLQGLSLPPLLCRGC